MSMQTRVEEAELMNNNNKVPNDLLRSQWKVCMITKKHHINRIILIKNEISFSRLEGLYE